VAGTDRHELVEAARVRAGLTVSELWLRYVALGGNGDLFDVDGYLSGLLPLGAFDQDVLAVAVNERLEELYRGARVPLAGAPPDNLPDDGLRGLITALLESADARRATPAADPRARGPAEPGSAT
jgi:hypothetical protein